MAAEPVVVLVETMGPANIGSVARSVAAYGLSGFRLVSPRCRMDESTTMWATYGSRLLPHVTIFEGLPAALANVDVAVALSRREGKHRHRHYPLPLLAQHVLPRYPREARVAFVFGNEESGLANHHLGCCHYSAEIPTLAEDGSLNLAHAVTVTLYEWLGRGVAPDQAPGPRNRHEQPASPDKLRDLLRRCEELLRAVGYPRHRSTLKEELVKLETILFRGRLEEWEVRLLMGMIKQVRYRLEHPL